VIRRQDQLTLNNGGSSQDTGSSRNSRQQCVRAVYRLTVMSSDGDMGVHADESILDLTGESIRYGEHDHQSSNPYNDPAHGDEGDDRKKARPLF
jgi:hypothetical protein